MACQKSMQTRDDKQVKKAQNCVVYVYCLIWMTYHYDERFQTEHCMTLSELWFYVPTIIHPWYSTARSGSPQDALHLH